MCAGWWGRLWASSRSTTFSSRHTSSDTCNGNGWRCEFTPIACAQRVHIRQVNGASQAKEDVPLCLRPRRHAFVALPPPLVNQCGVIELADGLLCSCAHAQSTYVQADAFCSLVFRTVAFANALLLLFADATWTIFTGYLRSCLPANWKRPYSAVWLIHIARDVIA